MNRLLYLASSLLVGATLSGGLAGCQDGEQSAGTTPPIEEPAAGLEVQMGIDQPTYTVGDSIAALIRVVNRSAESRELTFPTGQRFDFYIVSLQGEEVLRWSADHAFTQQVGESELEPEGDLEYQATVPLPTQPGSYRLHGVVTATGMELTTELPLEVME